MRSDGRQRILIVMGDMRPTREEAQFADVIIKVPPNGVPQLMNWTGPPERRPIVAGCHRPKPKAWRTHR